MNFPSFRKRLFLYLAGGAFLGLLYALFVLAIEKVTHDEGAGYFIPGAALFFGAVAVAIAMGERQIRHQVKMLEEARRKFSSLTLEAIARKNWEISFSDPSIPTCWREKGCNAVDCPSYGKEHVRCWLIAGTFCRGEVQGRFAQKFGSCTKCEIYQAAVQRDPINEINENFNNVMWVLREHEELLADSNARLKKQFVKLEQLQQKTREMADSDMLTGLRNRAHFQDHLQRELRKAGREGGTLALAIIDLDYFKSVNDEFGHQTGDAVLREFGSFLRRKLDRGGYAARYGGEEFAVVLSGAAAPEALALAETIRRDVKEVAAAVDIPSRYVGASIGVADFPRCAGDADSLISAADTALLFAKRSGRDQVAYFCDISGAELDAGDVDGLRGTLAGAGLRTLKALAEAVDTSDSYSTVETARQEQMAREMAAQLGLDAERVEALALADRLHDIGKVGVPGSILRKKETLSPEEMSKLKEHPRMGHRLLEDADRVKELMSAILYHHERWDGKGYPEGLEGEEIPLMARVIGIIDAYRSMRSDRPYRKAMDKAAAIEELRKGSGSQFDPHLVDRFIELLEKDEPAADAA